MPTYSIMAFLGANNKLYTFLICGHYVCSLKNEAASQKKRRSFFGSDGGLGDRRIPISGFFLLM